MRAKRNRRAVGADPEALSGGAYSRRSPRPQTDPGARCSRNGAVNSQYRGSMAHASPSEVEVLRPNKAHYFHISCYSPLVSRALLRVTRLRRDSPHEYFDEIDHGRRY
jgi:hypothetical protein